MYTQCHKWGYFRRQERQKTLHITIDNACGILFSLADNSLPALTLLRKNNKGMLLFSFEDTNLSQANKDILSIQAYHLFKSLFHTHHAHDDEQDALLRAPIYSSAKPFADIEEDYLAQYHDKFTAYYDNTIGTHNPEEIYNDYINHRKGRAITAIGRVIQAQKQIHKALHELSFANLLAKDSGKYQFIFSQHALQLDTLYKEYEVCDDAIDINYAFIINRFQIRLTIALTFIGAAIGYILSNLYHPEDKIISLLQNNQAIIKQNAYAIKAIDLKSKGQNPKTLFLKP